MSDGAPLSALYARHPLICGSSSLPPAVLLAAKLAVLTALVPRLRHGFEPPFLPFWTTLDHPAIAIVWPWILGTLFFPGAILVLFNLSPRLGAFCSSLALLLDLVAGRLRFSNSTLLLDLLLLIFALSGPRDTRRWVLRAQLALVYGGAAFNKLLHPDWQNGQFFSFWTREILHLEWFTQLDRVSNGQLAVAMGWLTIAVEAALAALACWPRATPIFIGVGLAFHVGMLAFTGGAISWVFLQVMLIAYMAFKSGPVSAPPYSYPSASLLHTALALPPTLDFRQLIVHFTLLAWILFP